jgi:sialic acid synthase SpsE
MVYAIAEIGFNHGGNIQRAEEMIRSASNTGVDAVKFQTFRATDISLPNTPHFESIKDAEMGLDEHLRLKEAAECCGLAFISTPFSRWAVDLLEKVGVPAFKVASMDCTNKILLKHIAQTGKPIFLSTGMAELSEIADSLSFLRRYKSGPVTLLHCMSIYPAKAEDLNLLSIPFLKEVFDLPVGYSDHYPGTDACFAAVALGAEVIETHFTLNHSETGGDHYHSADPHELKKLMDDICMFRKMGGSKTSVFDRPDRTFSKQYRRGVHAAKNLKKGDRLQKHDFLLVRPESDFYPDHLGQLIGKRLKKNVPAFQTISSKWISSL